MEKEDLDNAYREFQTAPSLVFFSPALAKRPELREEIIALIKGEPADEWRAYLGHVHHPAMGKLEWMIYLLPGPGPFRTNLAMAVRLLEEFWIPEIFNTSHSDSIM